MERQDRLLSRLQNVIILSIGLFLVACGGGGGGGTPPGATAQTISGTAAAGAPLISASITVKDAVGATKSGATGSDGKYSIDVTGLTPPFLLKVVSGANTLYSVASAAGTTNIHPFTDLIIRNYYKVKGSDVDTVFGGVGPPALIPTAAEITTIADVTENILTAWLSQVGLNPTTFNLIGTPFNADGTGFDKVLDNNKLTIDASGQVTLTTKDPATGIEAPVISGQKIADLTAPDTTPPSTPSAVLALPGVDNMTLAWNSSTDNFAVAGYAVYEFKASAPGNIIKLGNSPFPGFKRTQLISGGSYCYQIEAFDGAGNISAKSGAVCATTLAAVDTIAPTAPTGLIATAVSTTQIDLSWTASTDNTGVLVYRIVRNPIGNKKVNGTVTNYSDTGLASGTQYCYTIDAVDAASNFSAPSNQACATTNGGASGVGAKFPIATTPEVPSGVDPNAGKEGSINAAFDGTNYLVGIQGDAVRHNNVTAQFISSSGALIGSRISTGRTGGAPLVAFNGTNYLMVWGDDATFPSDFIYGQVFSTSGTAVTAPFVVSTTAGQMEPGALSCLGTTCTVVWSNPYSSGTGGTVYGRDISPTGSFLTPEYTLFTNTRTTPGGVSPGAICDSTSGKCLFLTDTGSQILGLIKQGQSIVKSEFVIATKVQSCTDHNLVIGAFDGTNYLVVWNDHSDCQPLPNWDVMAQRLDASGNLLGTAFKVNSANTNRAPIPTVSFDGTNFLITWTDGRNDVNRNGVCDAGESTCYDVYGQYVSQTGSLVSSEFIINNDPGNQLGVTSGFSGGNYLILLNTGGDFSTSYFNGDAYGVFVTP